MAGGTLNSTERTQALARRRRVRILSSAGIVVVLIIVAYLASDPGGGRASTDTSKQRAAPACDADVPQVPAPRQYEAPGRVLEEGVDYAAVITTSCGDIAIDLLETTAPENVNNFLFLAQEGFYDGLQFFRVERNSVIQAGDPNNVVYEAPDGPGYTIPDELPAQPKEYVFGAVAMSNQGPPDTAGSQFFIVIHENRPAGYQAAYSIFGRVDESSYEVLREIGRQPTKGGREPLKAVRPIAPIYIESIEILER
ncbi:MAG: peptidylprolyl isomerase [Actinomycetota bacterium]|nr:peptidylprolyl isomerase [Actinomycetota bacterium]